MKDAAIINTNIISQFENLIRWLLPYKKKDTVRKSGKSIIMEPERPWHRWRCDTWKATPRLEVLEERLDSGAV